MHEPIEFKVLYLFAGPQRDTGIPEVLRRLAESATENISVETTVFDILRDRTQDLLNEDTQADILDKLRARHFDAVIMSPPCATWSRAPWANSLGPKPRGQPSIHGVFPGWKEQS